MSETTSSYQLYGTVADRSLALSFAQQQDAYAMVTMGSQYPFALSSSAKQALDYYCGESDGVLEQRAEDAVWSQSCACHGTRQS